MALLVPLLTSEQEKLPDCFALGDAEAYIGRHPSCKVLVESPSVSRMHARVFLTNGQWMVEDLRSLNGIAINGKRTYYGALNIGDILQVGRLFFTLANANETEFPALKDWLGRLENQARFFEQQSELFPEGKPAPSIPAAPSPSPAPQAHPAPQSVPPFTQAAAFTPPPTPAPQPAHGAIGAPQQPHRRPLSVSATDVPTRQMPALRPIQGSISALGSVPSATHTPSPAITPVLTPAQARITTATPTIPPGPGLPQGPIKAPAVVSPSALKVKQEKDWTVWIVLGVIVLIVVGLAVWRVLLHKPA